MKKGRKILVLFSVAILISASVPQVFAQTTDPVVPGPTATEDDHLRLFARLSEKYNVEVASLTVLLEQGYEPNEIWLALELRTLTPTLTMEQALAAAQTVDGRGWGVLANMQGITPGSDEFHALKTQLSLNTNTARRANAANRANTASTQGANGSGYRNGYQDDDGDGLCDNDCNGDGIPNRDGTGSRNGAGGRNGAAGANERGRKQGPGKGRS